MASQAKRPADDSGPDRDDRLDRLDAELARHKAQRPAEDDGKAAASSRAGYAQAMRMSSEFIAGVLLGAGLGWLIDRVFGTTPWGLIIFLLFGFAAGVLNVLRAAKVVEDPRERLAREERERREGN